MASAKTLRHSEDFNMQNGNTPPNGAALSSKYAPGNATFADDVPQAPTQPKWHDQHPAFVHSLEFLVDGIKHHVVIRGDNLDDLWVKVKTYTHMVRMARDKEVEAEDAAPTEVSDTHYLHKQCDIHGEIMNRSKDGKGYFHKAGEKEDGKAVWCRGTK